jgi:hypothetical protein
MPSPRTPLQKRAERHLRTATLLGRQVEQGEEIDERLLNLNLGSAVTYALMDVAQAIRAGQPDAVAGADAAESAPDAG